MSELAVRQIDRTPLLEQLHHGGLSHTKMPWIGFPPGVSLRRSWSMQAL